MLWGCLVNILNVLLRNIVFKVFSYLFRFCNGLFTSWEGSTIPLSEHYLSGGTIKSFPSGSDGKESAAMQETQVRTLGWEGSLEKGMATHSNIHTWRTPWTEKPGGLWYMRLQSCTWGCKELYMTETFFKGYKAMKQGMWCAGEVGVGEVSVKVK